MRGSVDYGDGFARPVEVCSGIIGRTKGGDANVRDGAKVLAPIEGVALIELAICNQGSSAGEGFYLSPV